MMMVVTALLTSRDSVSYASRKPAQHSMCIKGNKGQIFNK